MTENQDPTKDLKSVKQEAFCKAIALEGMNQSNAYRKAYNTSNMKPETINEKACELAKDGKVTARIDHLKATLTEEVIKTFTKTKDDILRKLEALIDKAEHKGTEITDAVSIYQVRECLKEQGKLLGYYEEKSTTPIKIFTDEVRFL